MSKLIKITPEISQQILEEFKKALEGLVMEDGKISFTQSFNSTDRKATLFFTETAWHKMQTLIREFDKEVAWHGIAKRLETPDKDEYLIEDILVYPQEVTSATVNTDQQEYEKWLMELDDDTFNNLRMQGHSHVNMSTSPSGVDLTHQKEILQRLDEDMFYIFLIWNKKNDKTIKIYDFAKNVLFETTDITVKVLDEENGLRKFLSEAKSLVADKSYTSGTAGNKSYGKYGDWDNWDRGSGYYGGSYYGGYSGTGYSDKKDDKSTSFAGSKKDEKKKGWRKGSKKRA